MEGFTIARPVLVLPPNGQSTTLTTVVDDAGQVEIYVESSAGVRDLVAQGKGSILTSEREEPNWDSLSTDVKDTPWSRASFDTEAFYENLATTGLQYGRQFKLLTNIQTAPGKVLGTICLQDSELFAHKYLLPPSVLDVILQSSAVLVTASQTSGEGGDAVSLDPYSFDNVCIRTNALQNIWRFDHLQCMVSLKQSQKEMTIVDCVLLTPTGDPVMSMCC